MIFNQKDILSELSFDTSENTFAKNFSLYLLKSIQIFTHFLNVIKEVCKGNIYVSNKSYM